MIKWCQGEKYDTLSSGVVFSRWRITANPFLSILRAILRCSLTNTMSDILDAFAQPRDNDLCGEDMAEETHQKDTLHFFAGE